MQGVDRATEELAFRHRQSRPARTRCSALAVLTCLGCGSGWTSAGAEADPAVNATLASLDPDAGSAPSFAFSTTTTGISSSQELLRDAGLEAARDRALPGAAAPPTPRVEITGWRSTPGSASLGLAVGMGSSAAVNPWADSRAPNVVDVGIRWRSPSVEQRRVDIAAFRRINPSPDAYALIHSGDQPLYAARVEMQFKSARFGGLAPELGAIGMQLEGGGKVVLRSKRGGPMVYYRSSF